MSTQEVIVELEKRSSKAVADCEAWRASGNTEKYIEAYDLVEALQAQLKQAMAQKSD